MVWSLLRTMEAAKGIVSRMFGFGREGVDDPLSAPTRLAAPNLI